MASESQHRRQSSNVARSRGSGMPRAVPRSADGGACRTRSGWSGGGMVDDRRGRILVLSLLALVATVVLRASLLRCTAVCSSTDTFSTTIPLACEEPPNGLHFHIVPELALLNFLSAHRCDLRWRRN
jgi:hypothetical protein